MLPPLVGIALVAVATAARPASDAPVVLTGDWGDPLPPSIALLLRPRESRALLFSRGSHVMQMRFLLSWKR